MLILAFFIQILSDFADCMTQQAEILNECISARMKERPNMPIDILNYTLLERLRGRVKRG